MYSPLRSSCLALTTRSKSIARIFLLLGLLTAAQLAIAQSVIYQPPAVSYVPAALPQPTATDSTPPVIWGTSLLQWSAVNLHPSLSYRLVRSSGIQARPGQQTSTTIQSISASILATIGTHWTLLYSPTQTFYSDPTLEDSLSHLVSLQGGATFQNWNFQISQNYSSSNTPRIETGQQTDEISYSTAATAGYRLGDRTHLDTKASQSTRTSAGSPESRDLSFGEHLNYRVSPRVDTSIGVDFGTTDVSLGNDMSYTRPSVQVSWKATQKIDLSVTGGWENRRFKSGGADDLNTATYSGNLGYHPFATTSLNVTATRGASASYFTNQVTQDTGWTVSLSQRLLQHYYFSAGYSERRSNYVSADPNVVAGRGDTSNTLNFSLSTQILQRVSISIFYAKSRNSSNRSGFGFSSNQAGLEIGYRF